MWGLLWEPSQGSVLQGLRAVPGLDETKPVQPHTEQSGRLATLRGRRGPEPGCCLQLGAGLSVGSHLLPRGHTGAGNPGSVALLPPECRCRPRTVPTTHRSRPPPGPGPAAGTTQQRGSPKRGVQGRARGSKPSPAMIRVLGQQSPCLCPLGCSGLPSPSGKFPSLIMLPRAPEPHVCHTQPPSGPYFQPLIRIRCGPWGTLMPFRRLPRFPSNNAVIRLSWLMTVGRS